MGLSDISNNIPDISLDNINKIMKKNDIKAKSVFSKGNIFSKVWGKIKDKLGTILKSKNGKIAAIVFALILAGLIIYSIVK